MSLPPVTAKHRIDTVESKLHVPELQCKRTTPHGLDHDPVINALQIQVAIGLMWW